VDIPAGLERRRQEQYGDTLVDFVRAAKQRTEAEAGGQ